MPFKKGDFVRTNLDDTSSFTNQVLKELQIMHLISAILLFVSRLNYFENIGSFKNFSSQGLIRLVTIPLYLVVLYRTEFAIRRYRPTYNKDAERTAFTVQHT